MPIYEYECAEHGSFELLRKIAEVREPAACPECGESGRRVVSAPNLATGSALARKAAAVNERSQHEPQIVKREHHHHHHHAGEKKRTLHRSHSGYPWALGH